MNNEKIKNLAEDYAETAKFKSNFPHHEKSVVDGYIEGYKQGVIDEGYKFIKFINSLPRKIAIKVLNEYVLYSDDDKKTKLPHVDVNKVKKINEGI